MAGTGDRSKVERKRSVIWMNLIGTCVYKDEQRTYFSIQIVFDHTRVIN